MMNGIYTPTDGPGPIGQDFSPGTWFPSYSMILGFQG